jgi:hypothetical protein
VRNKPGGRGDFWSEPQAAERWSQSTESGKIVNDIGFTDIFILPPYQFGVNRRSDHQFPPARKHADYAGFGFCGQRAHTLKAYQHAIEEELSLLFIRRRLSVYLNFTEI